jgi:hypothetical protein
MSSAGHDGAHAAWAALKRHLEARYRALHDEVRHYPTPIAHCDEQLPGLIEQRTRALAQLRRMGEEAMPARDFMLAFLDSPPSGDDDEEVALRERLAEACVNTRPAGMAAMGTMGTMAR